MRPQPPIATFSPRIPISLDPGPRGGRYNVDAFLLADFASERWEWKDSLSPAENTGPLVADLGTGTGVVALLLAYRCAALRVFGFDLREGSLAVAVANARNSRLTERAGFVLADVRRADLWSRGGWFDGAVINPPYRKAGTGRLSPDFDRAMSRHEVSLPLDAWLGAVAHMIRPGGFLIFCHLAERETEVIQAAQSAGFQLTRLRRVHPMENRPPTTILAEAVHPMGDAELAAAVHPPLIVYEEPGMYTEEARMIYERFGINLREDRAAAGRPSAERL